MEDLLDDNEHTKLSKEQQRLVEDNHLLIYHMLNKMKLSIDEYYDVAAIAIVKAALAYKEQKGKFSSFACACMFNALLRESSRQSKNDSNKVYLSEPQYKEDRDSNTLADQISDNLNIEDDTVGCSVFAEEIKKLTLHELRILQLRLRGYTVRETAIKLGTSLRSCTVLSSRVNKKLRGNRGNSGRIQKYTKERMRLISDIRNRISDLGYKSIADMITVEYV